MPETTAAIKTRSEDIAVLAELDSFAKLADGWNGYSAKAPTFRAIENAKALVCVAHNDASIPARVEPSAMGGVGVTFSAGNREVVVEFYNDGTAHALFADNVTEEMDTRPLSPDLNGYRVFLDEVRKYRPFDE